MITKIFNAKKYYNNSIVQLKIQNSKFNQKYNNIPCLAILTIDNKFCNNLFIKNKIKACLNINLKFLILKFSKNIKINTIIMIIKEINSNTKINAIIVQTPIPKKINKIKLFQSIKTQKDIDLLNPKTFGTHIMGYKNNAYPCTAIAILKILKNINTNLNGTKITVFGFSNIVTKPLIYELYKLGATIISINKKDQYIKQLITESDIIITATGVKNLLSCYNVPIGSIIIDVGIFNLNNNITIGDIKINKSIKKIKYITPVPGGIGLITIMTLLKKVIKTSFLQNKKGKQNGRT